MEKFLKKFILWLAYISGVERDLDKSTRKQIGNDLVDASHWLGGGNVRIPAGNALCLVGRNLQKDIGVHPDRLRDSIDELDTEFIHKPSSKFKL